MADWLLTALLIAAGVVLAVVLVRAVRRYNDRLDGRVDDVCGAPGPYRLHCDREPHDGPLHRCGGIEWWPSGGDR